MTPGISEPGLSGPWRREHDPDGTGIRFAILGPVQALVGDRPLPLGGPGPRALLALLVLRANQVVAVEEILLGLWGDDPPLTARTIVQNYVSRLRRQLRAADGWGTAVIVTRAPGYQLTVDESRIDVHHARALLTRSRHEPPVRRAELLRQALALWRGPVLADVAHRIAAPELEELRFAVLEARIEADLELGRHAELVGELTRLVREHPFREQMVGQLVLALYRAGLRGDALEVYQRFARRAANDLGIDPGPALRTLHGRVLDDDAALLLPRGEHPVPPRVGVLVPAQLPAPPTGFVGRDEELAWLDRLSRVDEDAAMRVGVLAGPAGIGKTALAVLWANRALGQFPDGQLYASLRGFHPRHSPVDAGQVLTRFLLALGVPPDEVPADWVDRAALYRSLLGRRRVLVLLDDVRDSAQVRLLLPGSARSTVLITSRRRLEGMVARNGARLLELRPLPADSAVQVIEAGLGAGIGDDERIDPRRLSRLAELCGYLPLALRIVAARLTGAPQWTVDELVDELADERTRLGALDAEEVSSGETGAGVRAALEGTRRGLPEEGARALRLLGLHPRSWFAPQDLAALLGSDLAAARRSLRVLTSTFLATETSRDTFVLPDLVRLYARGIAVSELPAPERAAARRRLEFDREDAHRV